MIEMLKRTKAASKQLALFSGEQRNQALEKIAGGLEEGVARILQANEKDVERARGVISEVMIDRLKLTENRILDMAKGVREAVDEFGILGVLKGPFSSMSAGVLASLRFGFIVSLFFHSKPKDF